MVWMPRQSPGPRTSFHPQFAWDDNQFRMLRRQQGMPAHGGKSGGKHTGKLGGKPTQRGTRVVSFEKRGCNFACREAGVVSLTSLFFQLADRFSACDLYRHCRQCRLLTLRRQHSWSRPEVSMASTSRSQQTGYYGWGGGQRQRWSESGW